MKLNDAGLTLIAVLGIAAIAGYFIFGPNSKAEELIVEELEEAVEEEFHLPEVEQFARAILFPLGVGQASAYLII